MKKNISLLFLLLFVASVTFAQNHKVYCKTPEDFCDKGLKEEGTITNGKKEGYWKYYYCCVIRQDVMEEGRYENDKKVGIWKYYDVGGYMWAIKPFVNGVEQGEFTGYHMTGEIKYKGTYVDGKLTVRREFYQSGKIKILEDFKTGEVTTYYENGKTESAGHYNIENWRIKEGEWKFYYEDGSLKSIEKYEKDLQTGICKEFYQNGKLKCTGEMRDNRRYGKWQQYHDNGQLSGIGDYIEDGFPLPDSWITYDRKGQKDGINVPEPEDWDFVRLCRETKNRTKAKDEDHYIARYDERLALMAGVDAGKDSPEIIKKKVQTFWNIYKTKCKCDDLGFDVPNGNFLKFLMEQNLQEALEILVEEYEIDINFIDPADKMNLMDYLIAKRNKYQTQYTNADGLIKIYNQYIELVKNIGGKPSK